MKQSVYGFSLLEFLIYFLLLQFFALLVVHWAAQQQLLMGNSTRTMHSVLELCAGHDLLMRDLSQAPGVIAAWKKREQQECIWHSKHGDIGWECVEDKLVRSEGTFNSHENRWVSRKKSLIAHGVSSCDFVYHCALESSCLNSITTQLVSSVYSQKRLCRMRNKVIL